MTTRIAAVANAAYQLFSSVTEQGASSVSKDGLARLLQLLSNVGTKDVDFDTRLVTDASGTHSPPVLYLHIVENAALSMGIFVLRPGARIPLHDHPDMFGLCRLIHGSLRCRAYSPASASAAAAAKAALAARLLPRWQLPELTAVTLSTDGVFTSASQPLLLTPSEGGYHELQALGDGAAFIDILAPPYDHDLGQRVCRYYREVALPNSEEQNRQHLSADDEQQSKHVYLLEIPQPRDFVCGTVDYTGPKVT
ncbi:hypothetical protein BOX15_Mlig014344g2 [Macrostomum lignano]|uniref:Cysteine dioxygenase n=1 Tax=Macrostomum lignano TaxID=282301 RepID=A0A267DYV0_9PLAT|nr:hypothetical protein BOX15_Mlig014344g5 [Macrostomum lignano]PAA84880.1 hypothetical protein BOX15_Mlig022166g1 [Macrostomum lignano]PAA86377.1 hypothetical protein BOX15_Mlig014344g2 [Macrostomum lignano]